MAKNRDLSKFPNAITVLDNGNVGIGTTSFSEGTQTTGTISIIPNSSVSSGPLVQFAGNGRIRPASTGDRLSIDGAALYLNSTFSGNVIIATGGGNVGIGVTNPSTILSVKGSTETVIYAVGANNTYKAEVQVEASGQFTGSLVAIPSGGSAYGGIPTSSIGITTSSTPLIFATNATEKMRLEVDGTLKLGTYHSTAKFLPGADANHYLRYNTSVDGLEISGYSGVMFSTIGGTERMRLNTNGHLTIPYQPSFAAYKSQNEEPSSDTILTYNVADVNRGNHYNTSNSRFTAPVAGVYAFGVKVWYKPSTTGTIWVHLRLNGVVYTEQRMSVATAAANYTSFFPKWVLNLAAGDYIEVSGYGDGSNFHSSNSARYSQFYGHLLH
jgi:hypothetical protein